MIEEILPAQVVAEEAYTDVPAEAEAGLFPEEAALVAYAVPKRRLEFATVRICARRALGRLGSSPCPCSRVSAAHRSGRLASSAA